MTTPTVAPPTFQPVCEETQALQESATAASANVTSIIPAVASDDSPNKPQGSLDESVADELFSTPPTSPIPPQDDDRVEVRLNQDWQHGPSCWLAFHKRLP